MIVNIPEYIQFIEPYKPGKPIDELAREYGIQHAIKLASNENPLGPSPKRSRRSPLPYPTFTGIRTAEAMT